jgi:hypothetical protein
MRLTLLYGIIILGMFVSCKQIPKIPEPAETTFTIPSPSNYDCYLNTAGTGRKVNLSINLVVKFAIPNSSGSVMEVLDEKNITFNSATQSFPLTISALIPREQQAWRVEVNIQGLECSPCASGFSDPREVPNGPCFSNQVSSNPPLYQAAKPRWLSSLSRSTYATAITLPASARIPNVPNSCNCTTP